MRKDTVIGFFLLISYFLLFIGMYASTQISQICMALLLFMNIIAFGLTLHDKVSAFEKFPTQMYFYVGSLVAMIAVLILFHFFVVPITNIWPTMIACVLIIMLNIRMQIAYESGKAPAKRPKGGLV